VPFVPNPATNVFLNVLTEGTNVCSVTFPEGIPINQWAFVASVVLDQGLSNRVEMVISGIDQAGAEAVADVLRVVPVSEASLPSVTDSNTIRFLPTAGGYLLRFMAKGSHHYVIERSGNLASDWSTLQAVTPVQDGVLEYVETKPSPGQAFYRIVAQ